MRTRARLLTAMAATAAMLLATPALAYTIYLKDGSSIVSKSKYVVRGDMAIILTQSGTETALPLAEIDVARTEAANQQNLGTAMVIEGGEQKDLSQASPPPPARNRLGDLIKSGAAGPAAGIPAAPGTETGAPAIERPRGFDPGAEPVRAARTAFATAPVAIAIRDYVAGQGLPVEVARGSSPKRALLVYETESEANVFRALATSAAALEEVRKQFPGAIDAFELLCETSSGSLGARFTLTPAQAAEIMAGRVDITRFFFENVEF
jgi:hypothetical protein